ncbi:ABC-2 type transport system ATP-binding protein [Motilibacter peucedani]|uniref:ABC-2 type transport system ATP-binding protein n=1 Tax=Motilibacter peucedani TaxID=598650 RepID=A0A420XVI1_9ACTN|nr:ABC transporter ATP-binding protein [Motilibacter peucedani]RKS84295.1 ABC-2 type transport system ATP-binding protein [Motilibacter peucedani]
MDDDLVVARGLTKRYGSRAAVDSLDLTVRRGEVYGFLGPNGAGKTTTLRMLLGLVRPTGGSARVLGHPPGDPRGLRGVGALVEGPGLFPHLSGLDNLRVAARWAGLPESAAGPALAEVGLEERAGDRASAYSLGMRQRLGVALALLGSPELLVLDEPTNGLDPAGTADMRALLLRCRAAGRTVLLSSHLLSEVQQVCDRVAVVRDGRVLTEGTVAELRGGAELVVAAEPLATACRVAEAVLGADSVLGSSAGSPGRIRLRGAPADVPRLNAELVGAGVQVWALQVEERSLEDVFLELTGGA